MLYNPELLLENFDHFRLDEEFEIFRRNICHCEHLSLEILETLFWSLLDLHDFLSNFQFEIDHRSE